MSKVKYTITETLIEDGQCRKFKSYGIKLNGKIVMNDISCNKQVVLNLIKRLGYEEIDPQQLVYIIEDSII